MKIGIDATNIVRGGGLTHLREMLAAADAAVGDDIVYVWAPKATLQKLPDKFWLVKLTHPLLDAGLLGRLKWSIRHFPKRLAETRCDVLFAPGANYAGSFEPYVSMSQNMLPFEKKERARFFPSFTYLRYLILNVTQARSFRNSAGIIYLTTYARDAIAQTTGLAHKKSAIIAHGIYPEFKRAAVAKHQLGQPFEWLYVSIINHYKHQDNLVKAVCQLKAEGRNVRLKLVGPAYHPALRKLQKIMAECDPDGSIVKYTGSIPYPQLPKIYHAAHGFVFPSSCENLPNILLEAMAAGLPIASSRLGPMPEVLSDAGVYFDPENIEEIKGAMRKIMDAPEYARDLALRAKKLASAYTWERCAEQTFSFIRTTTGRLLTEIDKKPISKSTK